MFDGWIRDFARWTPRAPAVVGPSRAMSYAELDADIDRFGAALPELGVGRTAAWSRFASTTPT
jgi:non-ribosomal peptide synthetase component E (peptide arylation enzyme)